MSSRVRVSEKFYSLGRPVEQGSGGQLDRLPRDRHGQDFHRCPDDQRNEVRTDEVKNLSFFSS